MSGGADSATAAPERSEALPRIRSRVSRRIEGSMVGRVQRDLEVGWVLRRIALVSTTAMVLCALACAPANAAPSVNSPPTTISPSKIADKATATLRPLVIALVVLGGLSFLVEELGRGKRKKRKRPSSHDAPARRPPKTKAKRTSARPQRANPQPSTAAPPNVVRVHPVPEHHDRGAPPPPPVHGRMWGRRPGQSVAERIAELDAERARWVRGEQGEIIVGEELDRLTAHEWWVFHAVPRGGSGTDIDHLVIGVGGVYTVNTKNVAANVWVTERVLMVGGKRTAYLPAAVSEARDAARRISTQFASAVAVSPVLAFTRPITIKAMPADVAVLQTGSVCAWLERRPRVFTPQQAYEIVLIADQQDTWA
jgi:hypothetical protein